MRLLRYEKTQIWVFLLFLFHFVVLVYLTNNFSISTREAEIFFAPLNLLNFFTSLSTNMLGQTDFALRLPFILFYFASSILLYLLTDNYFKSQFDRFFSLAIFMMLPGVNSAALLVNESIIVIFFTLLYLYLYKISNKENYILLALFLFIDNSFAILFLALFLMSLQKKDNYLLIYSLVLFGISMGMHGFEIGGRPRGYFIDTFGIYASIFSPLLFLYFFYSIYRIGIKEKAKDMFWYISTTALVLSLIFSLRQKIAIEDFAPFVVIAIPLMVKLFMHSIRIRLKEFRKYHYIFLSVVLFILVLNFFVLVFNHTVYLFLSNPRNHFAHKYHGVKELAQILKNKGITKIRSSDSRFQKQLLFYGIEQGDYPSISSWKKSEDCEKIKINYMDRTVNKYYICPL